VRGALAPTDFCRRSSGELIGDKVQLKLFAERPPQDRETVIPAKAGIHCLKGRKPSPSEQTLNEWIPAFAGMTAVLA
jgi:hypothetical protein